MLALVMREAMAQALGMGGRARKTFYWKMIRCQPRRVDAEPLRLLDRRKRLAGHLVLRALSRKAHSGYRPHSMPHLLQLP